jgi:hypothetical protein
MRCINQKQDSRSSQRERIRKRRRKIKQVNDTIVVRQGKSTSNFAISWGLPWMLPEDSKECSTLLIEECGHSNMADMPVVTDS